MSKQKHIGLMMKPFLAQAAFEGRKTMTRRTKGLESINPAATEILKVEGFEKQGNWAARFKLPGEERYQITEVIKCPYGEPGDLIYVKETFQKASHYSTSIEKPLIRYKDGKFNFPVHPDFLDYFTSEAILEDKWRPSRLMPKIAARTWGEITSIRVERLQDITEEDAIAEGVELLENGFWVDYLHIHVPYGEATYAKHSFESLWDSINGLKSYAANPWVWVIEFERCDAPALEGGAK